MRWVLMAIVFLIGTVALARGAVRYGLRANEEESRDRTIAVLFTGAAWAVALYLEFWMWLRVGLGIALLTSLVGAEFNHAISWLRERASHGVLRPGFDWPFVYLLGGLVTFGCWLSTFSLPMRTLLIPLCVPLLLLALWGRPRALRMGIEWILIQLMHFGWALVMGFLLFALLREGIAGFLPSTFGALFPDYLRLTGGLYFLFLIFIVMVNAIGMQADTSGPRHVQYDTIISNEAGHSPQELKAMAEELEKKRKNQH